MTLRRRAWFVASALAFMAAVWAAEAGEFVKENDECTAVKIAWGAHGLGSHMVPSSRLPGLYATTERQRYSCKTALVLVDKNQILNHNCRGILLIYNDYVSMSCVKK